MFFLRICTKISFTFTLGINYINYILEILPINFSFDVTRN